MFTQARRRIPSLDPTSPGLRQPPALAALLLLLCSSPVAFGATPAADPESSSTRQHYQLILSGRMAGEQWVEYQPGGRVASYYSYNDRGRGDEIRSEIQLNEAGLPDSIHNQGHDYFKVPVEESYRREGANGHWLNESEDAHSAQAQGRFYLPLHGTPEINAILARALRDSPKQQLEMLPAGHASLREMQRQTIATDSAAQEMVLYFIEGLGFTPEPIWLTVDGTESAQISSWFSVVPQSVISHGVDTDSLIQQLLKVQQEALDEYNREQARQLRWQAPGDVLIRHARLYDSRRASVDEDMAILIRGERIAAVGRDDELWQRASAAPGEAELHVLDAAGRFVMPGLWDSHQHFGPGTGLMDLASGVTSARDLANDTPTMLARQRRFDQGEELGPRTLLAGFMDGPGPLAGPTKALVDSPTAALEWVERYASQGHRQIKVYSSLKPELVAPIARAAHARGLRLSGHVPAFMTADQFIRAGADEIQHMNMVFLNFLADIAPDTRDTTRFSAVAEHAYRITPDQPQVQALIALMRERHTVLDPTLTIFEGMFSGAPQDPPPGLEAHVPRLPPQVGRGWKSGALPVPEGQEQNYAKAMPAMLKMLKALHQAGIPIVAGTDALPGLSLYRELALYVEAGLSPLEALQTATWIPAQVMGVEKDVGAVAPGSLADLILIDGTPDRDIEDVQRVQWVVKGGEFYRADELQKALGIRPLVDSGPGPQAADQ